jgi:hypothetical protein
MLTDFIELFNNIYITPFYLLTRWINPFVLIEKYYKVKKLRIEVKIEEEKLKSITEINK